MKTEELIEGYLVYTDNGIEKVHWCNVNGVKELVSPKGKVYGYVPDYFEVKRLQEQLAEANEVIANFRTYDFTRNDEIAEEYQVKYGIEGEKIYTNKKPPKEFERWRKKITKSLEKKLKREV